MSDLEPLDYRLIQQLQAQVAAALNVESQRREAAGERELARSDEQQMAWSLIATAVAGHLQLQLAAGIDVPVDRSYDERLANGVFAAMYGAGELQELLDDPEVENIDINGADEVWVRYAGHREAVRHRPVAANDDDLIGIIQAQAAHAGINARPWTPATPELDLRLADGSRLSAIMGAGERPSISIRKNRFPQMFLPKLVELGTVDEYTATFLQAAVLSRCNIMVCGSTDAGKTTLLRALINVIPSHERLITVEKAAELGLRRHPEIHPNVVEWEMVLPDAEGRGGVSMAKLVQRSLRQDPDRVIVGEVLGEEIVTMLNAMSQGNDGSLSTIHARNAVSALDRIASYAAQADGLSFEVTHSMIAGAVDFIVFIRKNPLMGGNRTVTEVIEVAGFDGERVTFTELFTPSPIHGRAERTDKSLTSERKKRLQAEGFDDAPWFGGLS
ncbi:Flp pilus assembly CpaF family ATPase [Jatrophihabitans sp. GAS493]|uniref:CpaF family protein n=1 Tax=Jatrophihabitans sp. GAS493 TaxID=1907575 RepID=UPI000BC0ADC4|nr:ATPase, T2SS/T4P/T4SS family [Jatrophihabitans sp. GAS493]SOD72948.1 Flp pilus assembly CpaF family ATPase [Jatrophihabitans sp. GAS493]